MDLVKVSIEPKKLAKYTLKRACLRDFNLSEKQGHKYPKIKHEEHENMQLNLKTTPSGLPLQGSGEISHASIDLSSSRGVWKPRKCKKVKGEEEKITNSRGEEASCLTD